MEMWGRIYNDRGVWKKMVIVWDNKLGGMGKIEPLVRRG